MAYERDTSSPRYAPSVARTVGGPCAVHVCDTDEERAGGPQG